MSAADIKTWQAVLGVTADGDFGPKTLAASMALLPEVLASDELPWIREMKSVFGLHEVRDRIALKAWLVSDGKTLGDPSQLPWCFTGDVEIMTEEGWQRLDNLTAARVYQVDDGNELSLTPFAPVRKPYRGKIDVFKHLSFTVRCDPDHRWWGMWGTFGRAKDPIPNRFGRLADMTTQGLKIPYSHSGAAGCGLTKDQLTLVAAVLSDGTLRRRKDGTVREIVFEVSKERKIKALHALGPDCHYVQKMTYGELTTKPLDVFTFKTSDWLLSAMTDAKELDRGLINEMSEEDARHFLASYRVFDGSSEKFHLYTSSAQRRDDLSQIAVLAGYGFGVSKKQSQLSTRDCYEIHITTNRRVRHIERKLISQEEFDGELFCVQVPQGRIVVREHGRGAIVTGNCGDAMETAMKRGLPGEPFLGAVGENPYWARNWAGFGREARGYGSVGVFERGPASGHVGILIGEDAANYHVLGGNQSDTVSVVRIAKGRLLAARWPVTWSPPPRMLPQRPATGAVSVSEI